MKIKFKNLVCPLLLSLTLLNPLFAVGNTNNLKVTVVQDNNNPLMLKISIEVKNATAGAFFTELKKSCGGKISFVYSPTDVASIAPITYSAKGITVEKLLSDLLTPQSGLTYSVEKNIITIKKAIPIKQVGTRKVNLSGCIIDEQKKPILGATIIVTGTTKGAITDDMGRFALTADEGQELDVSYVGMVNKKYKVKANEENATIILVKDAMEVEDVIVTGYQSVRRERMTGSSTTVNAKDIEGRGLSSINEVLSSTISGLNMVSSGRPGADAQIQIRGINSINGSSEPMWIVDGMPMQGEIPNIKVGSTDLQSTIFTSGIGNIAPDDIKSITVLKDAAATAVYGARAANGVIVVETKSGLVGKTRYNFSANFGIVERPVNNIEMMNTQQKIQFERELFQDEAAWLFAPSRVMGLLNRAAYGEISSESAEREISRLSEINTDWFKEVFRTAVNQQYNFSMSGGTEATQHYTSINYTHEAGTQLNNNYSRLGMSSKITHNPTKTLRITGGLSATVKNDKITASKVDPLNYAMFANPYERPYNPDGSYAYDVTYNPELSVAHPGIIWDKFNIIQELENNTKTSRYIDAEIQLKVEWELIDGLMFTTHGIYNVNSNHDRIEEGAGSYTNYINNWYDHYDWLSELDVDMSQGSLQELTGQSDSYTWKNTLQYNKEIKDKHFINVFIGQEIMQRKADNFYNYSPIYDKLHNIIGYPDMSGVPSTEINFAGLGNTGRIVNRFSSFFGNASYSYKDRYIITGALRYDGADIIGNQNQFTPLWNVAGRWNLHNEKFIEKLDKINILSFRAGYGFTGSIDRGAFPFLVYSLGQSVKYDGQNVPTSFSYPNPNIKWQTKKDFNVGFDLSLFDYRVELTANYYSNITRDVLDNKRLAVSSGRREAKTNIANLHNNGYEIDLGLNPIRRRNFNWFIKFNVAYNENKVKDTFYKSVDDLPTKAIQQDAQKFVENYSAGSWFGYRAHGVNPMTGTMLVKVNNSDATYDMGKEFYDIPGNMLNYLGLKYPPWVGGFSTTITWKQFIFSANFEFKAGHKIKSFNMFKDLDSQNRHVNDLDRWRQPGDITNIPRQTQLGGLWTFYMYDTGLEKGDYLKCGYMTLGYNLPPALLKKIGFSTARVSFTAKDLFTLTKYKGIDPLLMGEFGYPNSRKYTVTLNFGL